MTSEEARIAALRAYEREPGAPIPMVLHCPRCRMQHVDLPQPEKGWTNPPHRSHECQGCGWIWRPADVATTGVDAITTRGSADSGAGDPFDDSVAGVAIEHLLRIRWAPPTYASFLELHASIGGFASSRLDFFAIGCWRSVGLHGVAAEVKVSRGDFLRELKKPDKRAFAESVARECWFACDKGVAKVEEIPERWGFLEKIGSGLVVRKAAPQRDVEPWKAEFVSAIARRSQDPKPVLPKGTWLRHGKELTDEDLLEVAKEVHSLTVEQSLKTAKADALNEHLRDPITRRNAEMIDVLHRELGWDVRTGDDVRQRLAAIRRDGLDPEALRRMRGGLRELAAGLDRLDPEPPKPAPGEARPDFRSPCPHPARNGQHEVYAAGRAGAYCRACGAESVPGAISQARGHMPDLG